MIKYNIAQLANQRRNGQRIILSPIVESQASTRAYLVACRKMLKALAKEVRTGILPAVKLDRLTRDADESTFQRIRALAAELARLTGQTVERILRLESIRHTDNFMDEAKRALGIDLTAVVRAEDLEEYLRRAVARNTSLITSLSDDTIKRVEQAILDNEIAGRSASDLKRKLMEEFGILERRAELIAKDQTAKLNSDMNKIRQQQAGIDAYTWSTANDERVRPLHRSLDGREYQWDEPTGAESGLPPGQPIRCRCIARAIVEFDKVKKAKPVAVPAPVITRASILEKLETSVKTHVVAMGAKTKKEHLWGYDEVSMLPIEQIDGKKTSVTLTPGLLKAISNPASQIVIHHNHPGSRSFSPEDLDILTSYSGMKSIWAHGDNGSSYYAERGTVQLEKWRYKSTQKSMKKIVQDLVDKMPRATNLEEHKRFTQLIEDWNISFAHVVLTVLDRQKRIKYTATLADKSAEAAERLKDQIENIVERLK